ncbi:pentapeptide repeat-containing protein [Rhodanobacter glycinis]|uniref:Pentapeptide repeat-containing protein n=1 Tax=Rhodanobacter glycinis TaxID=582702 RepID=A0A5B9DWV8_9GAMM|nr:pentapeptide repeat-containing protein [Rhodanobacter glycinis]QEE24493.1 pentapeptide repeat-containing protein [Rhodanobacter glycinis]
MKFEIKNRWTGTVQYSCELDAEIAGKSYGIQIGFAVKKALADGSDLSGSDLSGSNLRGSNLRGSNLRGSDLSGSDLSGSDLSGSDLSGSDLRGSDLSGSDLSGSNLRGSNLRGSNLRGSDLSGSDLSGSDLRGSNLSKCPVKIDNIHSAVYAAASAPKALNMSQWHTCETTHCRAGWVIALAGEGGRALEFACGTPTAAAMIYVASDPDLKRIPDFYCGNDAALDDMRRLAEAEQAA